MINCSDELGFLKEERQFRWGVRKIHPHLPFLKYMGCGRQNCLYRKRLLRKHVLRGTPGFT